MSKADRKIKRANKAQNDKLELLEAQQGVVEDYYKITKHHHENIVAIEATIGIIEKLDEGAQETLKDILSKFKELQIESEKLKQDMVSFEEEVIAPEEELQPHMINDVTVVKLNDFVAESSRISLARLELIGDITEMLTSQPVDEEVEKIAKDEDIEVGV